MATRGVTARRAETAKTYQVVSLMDVSGGLDLRTTQTLMAPSRARELLNFSLATPGELAVRPGYVRFSTTSLGSGRPQGGARIYINTAIPAVNSTAFTLLAWQGGVYPLEDNGTFDSTTPVLTGRSISNPIFFPHDRDLVAVFDGATSPQKSTNGSSWTLMGIAASSQSVTLSTVSTGGLSSGEFEVTFSYKARGLAHESNTSSAVSTRTIGSSVGSLNVVIPNSTDLQVDAIVLYARNKTAGETIRRKASSGGISTTANSTLQITSSNWTSNDPEPTNHNRPPTLSFGVIWKNRWWARHATRTNRLHFTELFQPQSWPTDFYIDIPFERGDAIRAMVALGDALVLFGTTKAFLIIGQTSLDFEVRPTLDSQDGAFGPDAVAVLESGIVHAGAAGVYLFDGASDRLLSYDLEPGWRDLVGNATSGNLDRVALVYHKLRKELRVAVPRRYPTTAFGEWILDLNRTRTGTTPAWAASDRAIGGFIYWSGAETEAGNRERLFSLHSTEALVFEEATGTTANSSNLAAEYEGPGLTAGQHRARWIDGQIEYEPHAGAFSIEVVIDTLGQGSQSVGIGSAGAVYGTAVYGTDLYPGAGRRQATFTLPLGADGRACVLKASYSGQETFRWFGYHLGLVPETRPRGLSD